MSPRGLPGVAVCLLLALGACSEDSPTTVPAGQILALSASATTLPADGASRATITAQIPAQAAPANRTVTFSTTAGTLVGATGNSPVQVTADLEGRAVVFLQSDLTPNRARVTAQVASFLQGIDVDFQAALPERISVDAGTFELIAGRDQSTTVTATLRRGQGFASVNTVVEFFALTNRGSRFGEFRNVTVSNTSGVATAVFSAAGTTFRGRATLVARVRDSAGAVVEGTATVEIISPPEAPEGSGS